MPMPTPPTITSVTPGQGAHGHSLAVDITGTNLSAATSLSFGAGVKVIDWQVFNDTQITATVSVDADAILGPRDVS